MQINRTAFVGIDPGAQGAIAQLTAEGVRLWHMPTAIRTTSRGKERARTCPLILASILRACMVSGAQIACVEDVWGIQGQSAGSSAALGDAVGVIRACVVLSGLRTVTASAQRWKYDLGVLKTGKPGSVALAVTLFPAQAEFFRPVRKIRTTAEAAGFAEAALIAHWCREFGNV